MTHMFWNLPSKALKMLSQVWVWSLKDYCTHCKNKDLVDERKHAMAGLVNCHDYGAVLILSHGMKCLDHIQSWGVMGEV